MRAAQIIFRPIYFFPCTASSKLCDRHCCLCQSVPASLYRSVAMAGMSGMRERTQMRTQMRTQIGPKCVDPILPHRYKDGWVAAKFGSTGNRRTLSNHIWVHILGPHFGSTRSGSLHTFGSTHSVPTRRTESKKNKQKKHLGANWGANIRSRGWGVLKISIYSYIVTHLGISQYIVVYRRISSYIVVYRRIS